MPQHSMAPMLSGLRVVMLGRQGSGKGTQGVQLARLLVVPQISVGDVLREAAKSGSPAGRRAATAMERGELVDDNLVVSLVAERLAAVDVRGGGFVLDGFPRRKAAMLAGILADSTLDRAVVIDVALEVARARLLARRVCTGCGRIYSVERARGLETWTCGACGGEVRPARRRHRGDRHAPAGAVRRADPAPARLVLSARSAAPGGWRRDQRGSLLPAAGRVVAADPDGQDRSAGGGQRAGPHGAPRRRDRR